MMAYFFVSEKEIKNGNYQQAQEYALQFLKLRPSAKMRTLYKQLKKW